MKKKNIVYKAEITLIFDQRQHTKNKKEAIKKIKESFYNDYNLEIENEEIKIIK